MKSLTKHRNITRASEKLHLTQPAVSRLVKLLQDGLHAELYKRTRQGIEVTKQGEMVLGNAIAILSQIDDLKGGLLGAQNVIKAPTLNVGGS